MAAWFGSKKQNNAEKSQPLEKNDTPSTPEPEEEKSLITITEIAQKKITELIQGAESAVLGVRILAEATSPMNPQYSLAFVQEDEDFADDTILDFENFKVYIDSESIAFVDNVKLDFISTGMGGGFRIDKVIKPSKLAGPLAERIQQVIEQQINPALALHGGYVQLIDVKDHTAYIELGGGCRGCGMVDVTLKQGIEIMIKQNVPEISHILDTTDHAGGKNPYYQPAK
jgi:Fe/S biogenesis protein NfuA